MWSIRLSERLQIKVRLFWSKKRSYRDYLRNRNTQGIARLHRVTHLSNNFMSYHLEPGVGLPTISKTKSTFSRLDRSRFHNILLTLHWCSSVGYETLINGLWAGHFLSCSDRKMNYGRSRALLDSSSISKYCTLFIWQFSCTCWAQGSVPLLSIFMSLFTKRMWKREKFNIFINRHHHRLHLRQKSK